MTAPIKGAAKVAADGKITQLGAKAAPDEVVTEADVKDSAKLAKLLARVLSSIATLRRTWAPRLTDFEDVPVTVGSVTPFQHNFNGRVRWWVVDWVSTGAGNATQFETHATSDSNTLRLFSGEAGVATIRVEEAG